LDVRDARLENFYGNASVYPANFNAGKEAYLYWLSLFILVAPSFRDPALYLRQVRARYQSS
jgi:hypothetical protein